jgi:hypothetical protein
MLTIFIDEFLFSINLLLIFSRLQAHFLYVALPILCSRLFISFRSFHPLPIIPYLFSSFPYTRKDGELYIKKQRWESDLYMGLNWSLVFHKRPGGAVGIAPGYGLDDRGIGVRVPVE